MEFSEHNNSKFYAGIKKEIDLYFVLNDKSRLADWNVLFKGVLLVSLYVTSYFMILFNSSGLIAFACWYGLLGVTGVLIVFNIVHDASHKAISSNWIINEACRYLGDIVGINTQCRLARLDT